MTGPVAPVLIRKASEADAPGIQACLSAAFEPYRNVYTPEAFADTVLSGESVQRRIRDMCVFVAVSEGKVVGTVGCQARGEEGHVRGMAVLPAWQGTGVASELLRSAESALGAAGCTHVTLDTTAPLRRAVRFYEAEGFSPSGRVSDFFGMDLFEYAKIL